MYRRNDLRLRGSRGPDWWVVLSVDKNRGCNTDYIYYRLEKDWPATDGVFVPHDRWQRTSDARKAVTYLESHCAVQEEPVSTFITECCSHLDDIEHLIRLIEVRASQQ